MKNSFGADSFDNFNWILQMRFLRLNNLSEGSNEITLRLKI